jgi:hypothetical protein
MYWALTAIFTFFQSRLERRISKGYVRGAPTGGKAAETVAIDAVDQDVAGPEIAGQGH